jgi:hypothetical protein
LTLVEKSLSADADDLKSFYHKYRLPIFARETNNPKLSKAELFQQIAALNQSDSSQDEMIWLVSASWF